MMSLNILGEEKEYCYLNGDCFFFAETVVSIDPQRFTMVIITDWTGEESIEESFYHIVIEDNHTGKLFDAKHTYFHYTEILEAYDCDIDPATLDAIDFSSDYYWEYGGHEISSHHLDLQADAAAIIAAITQQ